MISVAQLGTRIPSRSGYNIVFKQNFMLIVQKIFSHICFSRIKRSDGLSSVYLAMSARKRLLPAEAAENQNVILRPPLPPSLTRAITS